MVVGGAHLVAEVPGEFVSTELEADCRRFLEETPALAARRRERERAIPNARTSGRRYGQRWKPARRRAGLTPLARLLWVVVFRVIVEDRVRRVVAEVAVADERFVVLLDHDAG